MHLLILLAFCIVLLVCLDLESDFDIFLSIFEVFLLADLSAFLKYRILNFILFASVEFPSTYFVSIYHNLVKSKIRYNYINNGHIVIYLYCDAVGHILGGTMFELITMKINEPEFGK